MTMMRREEFSPPVDPNGHEMMRRTVAAFAESVGRDNLVSIQEIYRNRDGRTYSIVVWYWSDE